MHRLTFGLTLGLTTGLWGAAVMMAILKIGPSDREFWALVLSAFAGAGLAGTTFVPLFTKGAAHWSVLAATLATLAGSSLGGLVFGATDTTGLAGAVLGPMLVLSSVVQDPVTGLVWIVGALGVHRIANAKRKAA